MFIYPLLFFFLVNFSLSLDIDLNEFNINGKNIFLIPNYKKEFEIEVTQGEEFFIAIRGNPYWGAKVWFLLNETDTIKEGRIVPTNLGMYGVGDYLEDEDYEIDFNDRDKEDEENEEEEQNVPESGYFVFNFKILRKSDSNVLLYFCYQQPWEIPCEHGYDKLVKVNIKNWNYEG